MFIKAFSMGKRVLHPVSVTLVGVRNLHTEWPAGKQYGSSVVIRAKFVFDRYARTGCCREEPEPASECLVTGNCGPAPSAT